MSKGLAKRRRIKRALDAARGNLHKIANGKALPVGLPEAPKPKDAEKLPASLRKMLALKEAAAKQNGKGRQGTEQAAVSQAQGHPGRKRGRKGDAQADDDEDGPSTSGRDEPRHAAQQRQQKGGGDGTAGAGGVVKGANPFTEQFAVKKLKDKKKEYLKKKEEQKRKKGSAGEVVVEKELELKAKDKVKFGEVVHAPLEVHLKRKHWAGKEKTANERCKEVFLKQMQQAQQRMAGGGADEGLAAGAGGKAGGAAGGGGAAGKGKKRKAPTDTETEAIRQQVIDSYRAAKKGGGFHNAAVGNATMNSLARLVGKGASGGKAAASEAHTLG